MEVSIIFVVDYFCGRTL